MRRESDYIRQLEREAQSLEQRLRPHPRQLREAEALSIRFEDIRGRTRLGTYHVLLRHFCSKLGAYGHPNLPALPAIPMAVAENRHQIVKSMQSLHGKSDQLWNILIDLGADEKDLHDIENEEDLRAIAQQQLRDIALDNLALLRRKPREELEEELGYISWSEAEKAVCDEYKDWLVLSTKDEEKDLSVIKRIGHYPLGKIPQVPVLRITPSFLQDIPFLNKTTYSLRGSKVEKLSRG